MPTDTPRRTGYTPEGGVGTVPNFDDTVCGGSLDQSIATSCNTAFAEVAGRVGADRLAATARAFGFGSEGLTEDVPLVASSVGDGLEDPDALARTGIGQQDVRATTMQMAVVAATIAAGGLGRTVRHVRGRCEDGRLAAVPEPEPRRVVSEPTARAITDGMRAAVRSGTARATPAGRRAGGRQDRYRADRPRHGRRVAGGLRTRRHAPSGGGCAHSGNGCRGPNRGTGGSTGGGVRAGRRSDRDLGP